MPFIAKCQKCGGIAPYASGPFGICESCQLAMSTSLSKQYGTKIHVDNKGNYLVPERYFCSNCGEWYHGFHQCKKKNNLF